MGGWEPPLGIALRADGLSAAMMMTTAIVICATGLFARGEFSQPRGLPEARGPLVFWVLLLAIWSALNAVVLGGDLFNLYVALELLTFAAVPLVCLKGSAETIKAALRYMLFALLGSVLYLLGTVLIYGAYGTLDIALLSEPGAARACRLDRGRADDHGIAGQDGALPAASVAAAGPCRRARSWQRGAVGPGRQRLVLLDRAPLVRRYAGSAQSGGRAAAGHAWVRERSCSEACLPCASSA